MNLKYVDDKILLKETLSLANQERVILSKLLWHLREVDRRKLYADLKCGSLFEYCIRVLKYSEGQASRRVSACRMLKELPEISEQIENGELNLMQLNQAKHFFSEEGITDKDQKMQVLEEITGKTLKETEETLNKKRKNPPEETINIKIKKSTLDLIREVQCLKAHTHKSMDDLMVHVFTGVKSAWDPSLVKRRSSVVESGSRYIPAQVRAYVWERDKGKCQNCGSTYAIQLDHKHAFAKGGKTNPENLQLLCRNCNQRKGMVEFKRGPAWSPSPAIKQKLK